MNRQRIYYFHRQWFDAMLLCALLGYAAPVTAQSRPLKPGSGESSPSANNRAPDIAAQRQASGAKSNPSGPTEHARPPQAEREAVTKLGEPQSLERLLNFAMDHAPAVLEARKRVGLGDAAIEGARRILPYNPEIVGDVDLGVQDGEVSRFGAGVSQRLQVAGQRELRIEAAQRQKSSLERVLVRTRWDVHQQVNRLYRMALVNEGRLALERDVFNFTRQLFDATEERFREGEEPRTSVIVARAELARARSRLVQARVRYVRTLRDLGATIGWDRALPPRPSGDITAVRVRPVPATEVLLKKALEHDPKLAVLAARRSQAQAELALEKRRVWPDPAVGLGYEREKIGVAKVEHKILFNVGVPIPLWDRNQGEIEAARARGSEFSQAIDNRKLTLRTLIAKQAETAQGAYRNVENLGKEVLQRLETYLDLLHEGFNLGQMSLLDVMNARDRVLATRHEYYAGLERYLVAVSDLERLLGTSIWDSTKNKE